MLNNLKKTKKNHVFIDDHDDMDIDNMDFPLPSDDTQRPGASSSSSAANPFGGLGGGAGGMPDMAQLQKMMASMNGGTGGLGAEPQHTDAKDFVAVASGPQGDVRKMNPEDYKE